MNKIITIILIYLINLSVVMCQCKTTKELKIFQDKDINCYITKNIELPSYANGLIKYHVTFNLNNDSTIKSVNIEDFYKIDCKKCEDNLLEIFEIYKWPFKIPEELKLPCKVKYIVIIDLINYNLECPETPTL